MRVEIQATDEELAEKADSLVETISALIKRVDPRLSDDLVKALAPKDIDLRYPVLKSLQKQTEVLYAEHLLAMLAAVSKVVDRGIKGGKNGG